MNKIDQAIKDMKQSLNKSSPGSPISEPSNKEVRAIEVVTKEIEPVKPKEIGRPTKMTEAMQSKLIKLAEELFFIRSVAGEAGISVDTIERHLKDKDYEAFAVSYTYALNRFIAYHQRLMMEYAQDKKYKDWRAEAHILTLTDKEFSERKYLTDAISNQDAKIMLLIKAEQLTLASKAGMEMLKDVKTVNITEIQPEKISLLPFDTKEVEQSIKKGKKRKLKASKSV